MAGNRQRPGQAVAVALCAVAAHRDSFSRAGGKLADEHVDAVVGVIGDEVCRIGVEGDVPAVRGDVGTPRVGAFLNGVRLGLVPAGAHGDPARGLVVDADRRGTNHQKPS
jgi:hypothetical protein